MSKQGSLNWLIILNVCVAFSQVSTFLSKYSCQDVDLYVSLAHIWCVFRVYILLPAWCKSPIRLQTRLEHGESVVFSALHTVSAAEPNFSKACSSCSLNTEITALFILKSNTYGYWENFSFSAHTHTEQR